MNRRTGSYQLFGISSDWLIGTSSRNLIQTDYLEPVQRTQFSSILLLEPEL
ncbi:7434_t:CDS:1, partial [Funneliformis caledonium]